MNIPTITAHDAHKLVRTDPAVVLVCAYDKDGHFRNYDLTTAISLSELVPERHDRQRPLQGPGRWALRRRQE